MSKRLYRKSHLVGPDGLVGVSAATLYRWIEAGKFPPPIHIGQRISVWPAELVHAWIDTQTRGGVPATETQPGFVSVRGYALGVR